MAIEKSETTAMQWLKEQTQNNYDVKEKYKTSPRTTSV